ncbi:hypothetical protein TMEN_4328 [Trichophyton mentagrophytes]|nr:hypothetical protein TMEN_4328 [Trichophyton mentagrophytes]
MVKKDFEDKWAEAKDISKKVKQRNETMEGLYDITTSGNMSTPPGVCSNSRAIPIGDTINFQTEADRDLSRGEHIFCGGEKTMNSSRVDLGWSYEANETAEPEVFAILEFKNTRTIHQWEFRPANSEGDEIKRINCIRR